MAVPAIADTYIEVESGHIYNAYLNVVASTQYWAGVMGTTTVAILPESQYSFTNINLFDNEVHAWNFPGSNLKDGKHYYAAMPINVAFDAESVRNTTLSDLQTEGLFNSTEYPDFYPNYNDKSDNPEETFCCTQDYINLSAISFQAYKLTLNSNSSYYLLKYLYEGSEYPLYIVPIENYECCDENPCNYQFILPSGKTYYFYVLSKFPAYQIDVKIDGVMTSTFDKTGLPYEVQLELSNIYTSDPPTNLTTGIFERQGSNLFAQKLSLSDITESRVTAQTNSSGVADFVISPTKYTAFNNYGYSLFVAVVDGDSLYSIKNLSIQDSDSWPQEKKNLIPISLADNMRSTVTSLIQLSDYFYRWTSASKGIDVSLTYYTNGTVKSTPNTLRTGAPNKVNFYLRDGAGNPVNGYAVVKETEGFLVLSPVISPINFSDNTRESRKYNVNTDTAVILVPTSYGSEVDSNITFDIYLSDETYLDTTSFYVNETLREPTVSDPFLNDEDLNSLLTATIQAINSLKYSQIN